MLDEVALEALQAGLSFPFGQRARAQGGAGQVDQPAALGVGLPQQVAGVEVRSPKAEVEDLLQESIGSLHRGGVVPRLEDGDRVRHLARDQVLTPPRAAAHGQGQQHLRRIDAMFAQGGGEGDFALQPAWTAVAIGLQPTEQSAMPVDAPDTRLRLHRDRARGTPATAEHPALRLGGLFQQVLTAFQPSLYLGLDPGRPGEPCARSGTAAGGWHGIGHGRMVSCRRMSDLQLTDLPQGARVLAIRLSAMGDIVFVLPVLEALKAARPDLKVDWLVEDRFASLLQGHPSIDRLHVFPRKGFRRGLGFAGLWRHLRGLQVDGRYACVLDFQSNAKSALQMLFLRGSHRIGFDKPIAREGAQRFHHRNVNPEVRQHRSLRDASLLRALGWEGDLVLRHRWPLPEMPEMEPGLTLLHTTTTAYGQDKAWLPERWADLARRATDAGHRVRLLWTPGDRDSVEPIADAAGADVELAPATPSLHHLMALSDGARLMIGTDSGPLHLAAYRGTPVVALFGPTDPVIYAPPGEQVEVVYAGEEGEAPPPRDRSRRSPWMDRIQVEDVLERL